MKAKLIFDLDDRYDAMAHKRCIKSTDMALALFELRHNFRKQCYSEIESKIHDPYSISDFIFNEMFEILDENGVNEDLVL